MSNITESIDAIVAQRSVPRSIYTNGARVRFSPHQQLVLSRGQWTRRELREAIGPSYNSSLKSLLTKGFVRELSTVGIKRTVAGAKANITLSRM